MKGINGGYKPKTEFNLENVKCWYAVKTKTRCEEEVKEALDQRRETMGIQDKLLRTVIPYSTEEVYKKDKLVEVKHKLYPGYVFVEMYMDSYSWYVVRNTKDVHGFIGSVGHGAKPTPVLDSDMLNVLRRCGSATSEELDIHVGDKVMIMNGPFQNIKTTVKEIIGQKAILSVTLLGQEVMNEFDLNNLVKC